MPSPSPTLGFQRSRHFWRERRLHPSLMCVCQPFTMALLVTSLTSFTSLASSLSILLYLVVIMCDSASDTESLLKFRDSLENKNAALLSSWNASIPPCSDDGEPNWPLIQCYKRNVWGLQLENMGLKGVIDIQSLQELPYLRTISLMNNNFDTSWPDINRIVGLKTLFLSNNYFSGEIPTQAFQGMKWLKKIHLSNNHFTGPIPSSLASMPRLIELRLEENQFTGPIPNFQHPLKSFSVANNQLEGEIPASLYNMPLSSFSGNEGLCGAPLRVCSSKNKSGVSRVVAVVLLVVAVIVIGGVILLVFRRRRRKEGGTEVSAENPSESEKKGEAGDERSRRSNSSSQSNKSRRGGENKNMNMSWRLSFVRDDREQFDLQELLRASAEILGSGCYSSSYKAALLNGPVMVVKRFKQMNKVGREEFQEHMRRIGRLNHPNLLPLIAYYYRKEEKLLVTDFVKNGSLAIRLHGYQALGEKSLDWGSRLKIVKGIARGVEYLYREMPSIIAAHGHLKSSNVLMNEYMEPILTDYGLIPVINQELAPEIMVSYKSPEYLQRGRITKKTDVWSLGILILEILTGNLPANFLQGKPSDWTLSNWVHSFVPQEWSSEVFDKDMDHATDSEGEMLKLLKIALDCCDGDVDNRLDLKQAVERIHDVKETDYEEDEYSSNELTFSIDA